MLNLPQFVPLIAFVVSVGARLDHADNAEAAVGFPTKPKYLAAVLSQLSRRLCHALRDGHPLHIRALLRFLASLSAQGSVAAGAVREQLAAVLDAAEDELAAADAASHQRGVCYLHAALAALPWWANRAAGAADVDAGDTAIAGWSASQGACDAAVAGVAEALLARAEALIHANVGRVAGLTQPADALSVARQAQLGAWADVPEDSPAATEAVLATLRAATVPDTVKLAQALRAALQQGDAAGAGAASAAEGAVSSRASTPSPWGWAVPTIGRPQDDPWVARLLVEPPQRRAKGSAGGQPGAGGEAKEEGREGRAEGQGMDADDAGARAEGRDGGADGGSGSASPAAASGQPFQPSAAYSMVTADAAGGFSVRPPPAPLDAAGGAASSSAASPGAARDGTGEGFGLEASLEPLAPPRNSFGTVPPQSAFYVKPGLQLFGPGGGLSSTPAVLAALQLNHPALAQPLALWCLRDVCHDVVVTYHPFHAETASALTSLPMGPLQRGQDAAGAGRSEGSAGDRDGGRRRTESADDEDEGGSRSSAAPVSPPLRSVVPALEALMTEMLAPGGGAFPEPYYTLVIINMLAQEAAASSERREGAGGGGGQEGDGLATRTIGIAARVLWKFLFALDDAALPALATWVSHHAASTRWDWLWEEWAPALTSDTTPPHDPQRRLVAALLQRTFALVGPWHHDAVVAHKFPAALVEGGFIPPKHGQAAASVFFPAPLAAAAAPAPTERGVAGGGSSASEMDAGTGGAGASGGSSGANAGAGVGAAAAAAHEAADAAAVDAFVRRCARESPGLYPDLTADAMPALRAFAGGLMGRLKAKLEAPDLAAWLRAAVSSEDGGAAAGLSHATVLLVLAHALLIYAKANMRNTRIILERYRALLADPAIAGLSLAPPAAAASTAAGGAAGSSDGAAGAAEANRVSVLLDALHGVWGRHRYIGNAAIVDLVDIGALSAQQVARYELKLTALAEPAVAPQERQAGAGSAAAPATFATPSGGSVSAAAAVGLLSERALALDTWETIAAALAWARDAAHRGGVELSLFLGARVFDIKEEEVDADVAEGRESVLRAAAATSAAAYEAAVVGAAQACADLCRVLQARLDAANAAAGAGGSASGSGGAAGAGALGPQQMRALRETLRVALAHSRALFLQHVPAIAGASPASAAAVAALQAVVAQGAHLEPDLVGAALAAALRPAADARLVVPEALLRDADVPAPTLV